MTHVASAERIATDDGCQIAVRIDGPPAAPAVILSSSLGTTSDLWAPQHVALAPRFRVLRIETRGHGASDAPAGDYTLERLGRDVLAVLDALHVERAHLCGLSLGGMIGQWLGAHAPDRIDRLVLANTAPVMGPAAGWQDRIQRVRTQGMESIVESLLERWVTPAFRTREPAAVERLRAMVLATDPVGYAGCCAAIRDMDLRATTGRITAPTLLVTGTADPSTPPATAAALAEALPTRPRVLTLDAAHLSSVEQPEAFNRALLEFLS